MMTKSDKKGAVQFATGRWAHLSHCFSSILLIDVRSAGSGGQVVTMIQTASLGIDTILKPASERFLPHDRSEFPFPMRGASGHRGSSGRTRLSVTSDAFR